MQRHSALILANEAHVDRFRFGAAGSRERSHHLLVFARQRQSQLVDRGKFAKEPDVEGFAPGTQAAELLTRSGGGFRRAGIPMRRRTSFEGDQQVKVSLDPPELNLGP